MKETNIVPPINDTTSDEHLKKKGSLQTLNIIAFSHDYIMLKLPQDNVRLSFGKEYFFEDFEFYKNITNYKGLKVQQVPVIRLFGANKYGQKCCLNVHNYFPYFYVKADRISHMFESKDRESVFSFLNDFCSKVEECFQKVYSQSNVKNQPNKAQKYVGFKNLQQIIHRAEIVYKKDYYGYHAYDEPFIKITYYNPSHGKKIQEMLIAGTIMNLRFQIYDGHISYFMHFYSDNYIYGMKEVYAINYKFRKDFSENDANIFQKFSLNQIAKGQMKQNLYNYEFDLLEIYQEFPQYFSRQQKSSTCYIEADVESKNLINFIYHCDKDNEEDENSDDEVNQSQKNSIEMPSLDKNPFLKYTHFERGKVLSFEITVQITKAIKELWLEENRRRQLFQINAPNTIRISLENNIEGSQEFRAGRCDIYNSVNHMNDEKVRKLFNQHILQYFQKSQTKMKDPDEIFLNLNVIQNFFKQKQNQKNEIYSKVVSRFEDYKTRKKGILEMLLQQNDEEAEDKYLKKQLDKQSIDFEIYKGDGDEDPEVCLSDKEEEEEKEMLDLEDIIKDNQLLKSSTENKNAFDVIQANAMKKPNHVAFWRNRYKVDKNNLKQNVDSIFDVCKYCNQPVHICRCQVEIDKSHKDKQFSFPVQSFFEQPVNTNELYFETLQFTYAKKPPPFEAIVKNFQQTNSFFEHQYPYYENMVDLFDHYQMKNKNVVNKLQQAQILSHGLIKASLNKLYACDIKNELKLPKFFRIYLTDDYESFKISIYDNKQKFKYQHQPPSYQQILKDFQNKAPPQPISRLTDEFNIISPFKDKSPIKTRNSLNQKSSIQNKFVGDITLMLIEIFARSSPHKLPNPSMDSVDALFFSIYNGKFDISPRYFNSEEQKAIQGMIIVDPINFSYLQENEVNFKAFYQTNENVSEIIVVEKEEDLIQVFIIITQKIDPDIFGGWDMEKSSLNYLGQRCQILGIQLFELLSRCPSNINKLIQVLQFNSFQTQNDEYSVFSNDTLSFNSSYSSYSQLNQSFQSDPLSEQSKLSNESQQINSKSKGRLRINSLDLYQSTSISSQISVKPSKMKRTHSADSQVLVSIPELNQEHQIKAFATENEETEEDPQKEILTSQNSNSLSSSISKHIQSKQKNKIFEMDLSSPSLKSSKQSQKQNFSQKSQFSQQGMFYQGSQYSFIQKSHSKKKEFDMNSSKRFDTNLKEDSKMAKSNQSSIKQQNDPQSAQQNENIKELRRGQLYHNLNLKIRGRIIWNIWRLCRDKLKLTNFDAENVYYELFQIRYPVYSNWTLTKWFNSESAKHKTLVFDYYFNKLKINQIVLDKLDIIQRTTSSARLYGCDFESIITRGSQFRVEGVLVRVTKQYGYLMLSASRMQVASQKILECMPLVMEPPKMLFVDPVIVMDFQSLYPSVMIAYNYCYSTCLGNINEQFNNGGSGRLGVNQDAHLKFEQIFGKDRKFNPKDMDQYHQDIFIAPNKVAYVRKTIREGILPQILHEFLLTRIMIKKSTGFYKDDKYLSKLLDAQQQSIKLFMCVVYGYTGASFSGRMPSVDIADSIVETGRYLLNQVCEHINNNKEWQAKVVYGDTDSVFVLLKGRSVEEAFRIGKEIAESITKQYPYPIELKFEKVFRELILVSKKRYVGYKMEKITDKPEFLAKGIEIVRRDGCDAVVKLMKKSLNILFETKNLSKLKNYLNKQWAKILHGHVNFKDFCIAKEVKLGKYKEDRVPAHGIVGLKITEQDQLAKPKYGERVKYLVVQGEQKSKVKDLVVSVPEFFNKFNHQMNSLYYINRQINSSLGRLFSTFDVDIKDWFFNMPKGKIKVNLLKNHQFIQQKQSKIQDLRNQLHIENYYRLEVCIICYERCTEDICNQCLSNIPTLSYLLSHKQQIIYSQYQEIERKCKNCSSLENKEIEEVPCVEYNCPYLYVKKYSKDNLHYLSKIISKYLDIINESF
ncbi:hypothetical protein ABPG73_001998 [Tetrahymena malaccensis]